MFFFVSYYFLLFVCGDRQDMISRILELEASTRKVDATLQAERYLLFMHVFILTVYNTN
jgi:hypothetical protein